MWSITLLISHTLDLISFKKRKPVHLLIEIWKEFFVKYWRNKKQCDVWWMLTLPMFKWGSWLYQCLWLYLTFHLNNFDFYNVENINKCLNPFWILLWSTNPLSLFLCHYSLFLLTGVYNIVLAGQMRKQEGILQGSSA